MPIDPNIALQVNPPAQFNPLQAYQQALTIKGLMGQQQLQDAQIQGMGIKNQRDEQLFQIERAGKVYDFAGRAVASLPESATVEDAAALTARLNQMAGGEEFSAPRSPAELPAWREALYMGSADAKTRIEQLKESRLRTSRTGAEHTARGNMPTLRSMSAGGSPAPGAQPAQQPTDGMPTSQRVDVDGYAGPVKNADYWFRYADAASRDPNLQGTGEAEKAINMALKLQEEERKAQNDGVQIIDGSDGQKYVVRGGYLSNGGDPLNVGKKAPEGFEYQRQKDGTYKLTEIPEYWEKKTQVAKAGATNVSMGGPRVDLGKPAMGRVDDGLLDTSAALMRMDRIGKNYRPEWSEFRTQAGMKLSALGEKYLGVKMDPKKKESFQQYTNWRRNTLDNLNKGIKEATGSAMGAAEADRIIASMPSTDDSPTEFQQKLDDTVGQYRMAMARFTYIKRQGGNMSIEDIPLEKMPDIMRTRDAELEAISVRKYPDMDKEERDRLIKRQLAQEFGLAYK